MKHPTNQLKRLKKSLSEAATILRRVPSAGSQTTLDHLKVQSYVLLAHAAFEEYLETLGYDCALEARNIVDSQRKITMSLLGLVSAKLIRDLSDKAKQRSATVGIVSNIAIFSVEAMNEYHGLVGGNHGIKADDQKKLLLPIGVDPEVVDLATMNNLDAFGALRGGIAHKFSAIRNELTRSDVESKVKIILTGIVQFDKAACAALSLA